MPADALQISVVVATKRRPERLSRLLDSLDRQSIGGQAFEVLITVDGPDPATEELLAARARTARMPMSVSVLDRSKGPATARNVAWRGARAPLVAFTDDDCEATPDWLETILAYARSKPGTVIQGRTVPNPADDRNAGPFSRTVCISGPTPWYQTCNITYPRETLERLDGFNEAFTEAAGEDADLGWRAVGAGTDVGFEPRACILHAVEDLGPIGYLRQALRGASSGLMFRLHPELRSQSLFARVFWSRTHALMLLAMVALALGRGHRVSYFLTLLYAKSLIGRARRQGGSIFYIAPYLVIWDLVHLSTGVRGSLRHRMFMI